MWNNNRYLEELLNQIHHAQSTKISLKDFETILLTIDNCINSNLHNSQYEKFIHYFIELFICTFHIANSNGLQRTFKTIIECNSPQSKSHKAYYLIKSLVQVCESVFGENVEGEQEKLLKNTLSLIKKGAEKCFGTDILNILLQYYGERLQKQIQGGKDKKLGFKILSLITSMLVQRYKNYSITFLRKQSTSATSLVSLIVLIEFENNPNFFVPFIESTTTNFSFSKFFKLNPTPQAITFIETKFINIFVFILHNNQFDLIQNLFYIQPIAISPTTKNISLEFVNKIYLDTFIKKTGLYLIDSSNTKKCDWEEKSKILKDQFQKQIEINNNEQNQQYHCKLAILAIIILNQECKTKQSLKREVQNLLMGRVIQKIFNDCFELIEIYLIDKKNKGERNIDSQQNSLNFENKILQSTVVTKKHLKEYLGKQRFQQNMDIQEGENDNFIKNLNIKENWKTIILTMFEIIQDQIKDSKEKKHEPLGHQHYNQMSLIGLKHFGIRPPTIQNQIRQKQKQCREKNKLFIDCHVTRKCLQLLQSIMTFINGQEKGEQFISFVKKTLSYVFYRVSESVIRKKISTNLFYSKCLLLTNHSSKCKILLDELLKRGNSLSKLELREELNKLLNVPQKIILEYAKFLSNRDVFEFKLNLYELESTQLDYLIKMNIQDLIMRE